MKTETRPTPAPLNALRHHVTGAIERGEAVAIEEIPAAPRPSNRPNVYKVKGLTGYQRHDDGPVYWFSGDVDTSRFEGVTRSGEGYKRL